MNRQLAMVVEADRCIGCHGCKVACKFEHDIGPGASRVNTYTMGPVGDFPHLSMYFMTVHCQQCEEPGCVAVCPTGACYRSDKDGVVRVDPELCIGCQSCLRACPYQANCFDPDRRVADKCDLCAELREEGKEPACVHNCPGGALHFGDITDPESDVAKLLAENAEQVYTLKDDTGVRPSGRFILKREKWIGELPHEFEQALREGRIE